jgi:6,7-dimethyl-8-ribityllumazine synthase
MGHAVDAVAQQIEDGVQVVVLEVPMPIALSLDTPKKLLRISPQKRPL